MPVFFSVKWKFPKVAFIWFEMRIALLICVSVVLRPIFGALFLKFSLIRIFIAIVMALNVLFSELFLKLLQIFFSIKLHPKSLKFFSPLKVY